MSLQAFRTYLFAMALCMIAVASFSQSQPAPAAETPGASDPEEVLRGPAPPPGAMRTVREESVTEGTLGDVILNGSAPSYGTFGVFLRANTTGAPDVGVRLGTTGSQPSTFNVFDSAGYPAWNVSFNAPGGYEGTFASLSGNKGFTRMDLNNSSPGSGTAASWTQLQFMEGATTKAYLLSVNSGSVNFPNGPGAFRIWNVANAPMTLATNNTERMRIDAAGNVGIGMTTPTARLEVIDGRDNSTALTSLHSVTVEQNTTQVDYGLKVGVYEVVQPGVTNSGKIFGLESQVFNSSQGTIAETIGAVVFSGVNPTSASYTGTVGSAFGHKIFVNKGSGIVTNGYGVFVADVEATNAWAFYQAGADDRNYFAGNVGIGTTANTYKLDVAGTVNVAGAFTGTSANFSGTVTGNNIRANYQDVAEWVPATEVLSAGTVVILDQARSNHVVPSSRPYDTTVAGVVSARPGIILGEEGDSKAMIATTGRVRARVDATEHAIAIGDLLVTSGKAGLAMKSVPLELQGIAIHRPGTVVGKALEPLASGEGEILVLLSLQ